MSLLYLAYGSNLHPARLQARVPSAIAIGPVTLRGWRLHFHKRGQDGSAKCNILATANEADRVHAVLYRMAARHRPQLDMAEGLGSGYEIHHLEIRDRGPVFFYQAGSEHIEERLRPYHWYKAFVMAGARHHALPAEYCAQIAAVPSIADPDPQRALRNLALLEGLPARS